MKLSIKSYISGQTALDIHEHSQLLGHVANGPFREFPPYAWFGEDDPEKNTLECLGTFGLQESSAWLRHFGYGIHRDFLCFVADPMRAVLDIVFFVDSVGLKPKPYFSEKHVQHGCQKQEILFHAVKMERYYKRRGLYEWIKHEFNNSQSLI